MSYTHNTLDELVMIEAYYLHIFSEPRMPSQLVLNEHSNCLLRKDGLAKEMDFNKFDHAFVSSIESKQNNIPWKILGYQTRLEVFLSYLDEIFLSSLI